MELTKKLTLARIILFGHRIATLKSFYVDHFGFSVTEDIPDEWVVLNTGSVEIALHRIGREYEPDAGTAFRVESNTKLVFLLNAHLMTFRQSLLDKGVLMRTIKSFEGINSLFCDGEDPEGNVFQIEQRIDSE